MTSVAHQRTKRFTWADYRTWPGSERWELVGGTAYAMSPSPSSRHQAISGHLHAALLPYFKVLFSDLTVALNSVFDFPLDPEEQKLLRVKEPPATYAP